MAAKKKPDGKPAYGLEKEMLRTEIEDGLQAGVEKLSKNVEKSTQESNELERR